MTASDWKKAFKQLDAKPVVKAKFIKHNKPKERKIRKMRKIWSAYRFIWIKFMPTLLQRNC